MNLIAELGPEWPDDSMTMGDVRVVAQRSAPTGDGRGWQAFAAMAADILFETDTQDCLTFLAPETVLGWTAADLLGRPARSLLGAAAPMHGREHVWTRTKDDQAVCLSISIEPLLDASGRQHGCRGIAVDVTAQELRQARASSTLRRSQILEQILDRIRCEVAAPNMMGEALSGVMHALLADGAAVMDLAHGAGEPLVLCKTGEATGLAAWPDAGLADIETSQSLVSADGRPFMICPTATRFGERAALLLWRHPDQPAWIDEDLTLANAVAGVVRIVLEHESIQREIARQTRTDALTGLLNRQAFIEQASRRLDRLEAEGLPASLLFIDLDGLKRLNDRAGHETGDSALLMTGALLRRTLRPTDLIARLGADEFACWLDGADTFTAAERAEGLRETVPQEFGHFNAGESEGLGLSIGIAMRQPGSNETLEQLLQRAELAMFAVKQNGRGHWRVSNLSAPAL